MIITHSRAGFTAVSRGVGSVKVVHSVSTDYPQERLDSHLLQRTAEAGINSCEISYLMTFFPKHYFQFSFQHRPLLGFYHLGQKSTIQSTVYHHTTR